MNVISVPTEKFRAQNPIFHMLYAKIKKHGVEASDFNLRKILFSDLDVIQIHFPEHFAMNYPPMAAFMRSFVLLFALVICKIRGVAIVWTVHNVAPFEQRNIGLYRLLMSAFLRLVDGCIFMSRSSEEEFDRRFPQAKPPMRVHIAHPSYPIDAASSPAGEKIVIGMIGEQKHYKQPLQSLRLFQSAHDLFACRLLIAGKVDGEQAFRAELATLPPSDVQWLNRRLDDHELEQAASQVNFVLLPYSMITNSGAAIYALSCQRPIVASPLPLFIELRERFGPTWVRIADGGEKHASFWAKPTPEDHRALKQKLEQIDLGATAVQHVAFFKRLRNAQSIGPKSAKRFSDKSDAKTKT